MSALGIALTVVAAPWQVDGSSLSRNAGRWVMTAAVDCGSDAVLGVAVVIYSRKEATMAWGHSSLRTVSCEGGVLRDREYETYRLSAWNERQFQEEHKGEPFATEEALRRYRGALVLLRNASPVDGGWFGDAQAHNREIYELWLDLPPQTLEQIAAEAERWYDTQRETLRAGAPLRERYRPLSTNCTTVLVRLLAQTSGDLPRRLPHLPFAWLRLLEEDASMRVLHPSHALVARWGEIPEVIAARPRPLFRRTDVLPEEISIPTAAVGPWRRADVSDRSRSAGEIGP